jgi:GNAT superfamily N-acetyltransferase
MRSRSFDIRLTTPADGLAVSGLLQASYPALMISAYDAGVLDSALPLMTRANPKLLASGRYYVARDSDGAVIGCGGWTPERPGTTESSPGIGHIRHFGTHPDWIGCGIGRAIYQHCEDQARAEGITVLECYASLNGVPFYTALGFVALAPIMVRLANIADLPSLHMRRVI